MIRGFLGLVSPSRFPPSPLKDKEKVMKAVVITKHGASDVLVMGDHPAPLPAKGTKQVVVDVVAAGVNPVDFKMRKHQIADLIFPKPKILGVDIAGVVRSVPEGSLLKVGDKVFGMLPLLGTCFGGYAQQCCIDENLLAISPSNTNLVDCAALPLVSCTVVQALRPVIAAFKGKENLKGLNCFVQAGSGGVGCLAVQYCANVLGMTVVTTCSPRNFDLMQSLGASRCIDYHHQVLDDSLQDVDVFVDTMGYKFESVVFNEKSRIMRKGGAHPSHYIRIASSQYGTDDSDPLGLSIPESRLDRLISGYLKQAWSDLFSSRGIKYHIIFVYPDGSAVREVAQAVEQGKIRAVIQETLPLEQAPRAHELLEAGHVTGKLVLLVPRSTSSLSCP